MKIRFASWNVNNRNFTIALLLRRVAAEVFALQEVSMEFHEALAASGRYETGRCLRSHTGPVAKENASKIVLTVACVASAITPSCSAILSPGTGAAEPNRLRFGLHDSQDLPDRADVIRGVGRA